MNTSFYFDHDYNALNDEKILELRSEFGLAGYGFYWAFIESLARSGGIIKRKSIGGLSLGYGLPKGEAEAMLDFCIEIELFGEDQNGVFSARMLDHINKRKELSEAGKRGAKKRWGNRGANSPPNSRRGEERRGKENKKEKIKEKNIENSDHEKTFEKFWNLYPRKISKKKSKDLWRKLSESDQEKALLALPEQMKQWGDIKYTPHPTTWLNQERWEDEIQTQPSLDEKPVFRLPAFQSKKHAE